VQPTVPPLNAVPSAVSAHTDFKMHTLWWRINSNKVPSNNPTECGLTQGTVLLYLCGLNAHPILGLITSSTRDSINFNPYTPIDTGLQGKKANRRLTSHGNRPPLPRVWECTANINTITDTLNNLEGRYIIAIGCTHEAIRTRAGECIIRIPTTSHSTLNQHLQDKRTVAAHKANRSKVRPRRPPIRYSDAPVAPTRLMTDLFQRVSQPRLPAQIPPHTESPSPQPPTMKIYLLSLMSTALP
jgi:hypothetical protein